MTAILHCMICIATLLLVISITVSGSALRGTNKRRQRADKSSLLCLILEVHMRTNNGEESYLECDLISEDDGVLIAALQIKLPTALVEDHHKQLRRGEWYVRIFGAKIEETVIEEHGPLRTRVWVPENANIITIPPEEGDRHVEAVDGSRGSRYLVEDRSLSTQRVRRILIARVSTSDRSPTYSASQLQQFYLSLSSYSVVRQYALCSSNWLWFKGYNNPYSAVVDVYVPGRSASYNQQTLLAAALPILQSKLNIKSITSVTEHVAFIFPGGLQGGVWFGYGTVRSYRTVFNDQTGGIPNTVMHELGHNLGLMHAGMGSDQYNDETDIMGYGAFQQFGPSKCFNGKHLWDLGWFADKTVSVDPFSHAIVQLACFVDYSKTERGQYIVINVGPFYLAFNQATGVNSGVQAAPNEVTIVEPGSYTHRVGAISPNTSAFEVANYEGSSGTLIIKVCSIITWNGIQLAVLSIGVNNQNCS